MSTTYSKLRNDYPGYNWSKFDRRTSKTSYSIDNSAFNPDNNIDYVFIVDRVRGIFTGNAQVWTTVDSNRLRDTNNNTDYAVRHGSWAMSCVSSPELFHDYFTHEFAHVAYGSPHYYGANYVRTDGKYFYPNMGWGFMSSQLPMFYTANATEIKRVTQSLCEI